MEFGHLVQARAMVFDDGETWCQRGKFVSLDADMPAPDMTRLEMNDGPLNSRLTIYHSE
jgi:hypothetical protein